MKLKRIDLNKKLYNYKQALKNLREDDYLYSFVIVEEKAYEVNSENKVQVINALNNAIIKLSTEIKIKK
ncbi:hypothetical protein [Clostridium nigeriense]|uniref:hypothetical protein n=1 Tax=Clostridium nigeriense TaxID=1805470 RepID=UPI000833014F|nr:hypothetical protein [Clostridium nigeriense]